MSYLYFIIWYGLGVFTGLMLVLFMALFSYRSESEKLKDEVSKEPIKRGL
jgi:prolipoprotein diacylglyceryltransferase